MGVAELPVDGTLDSLIRSADRALYRAKHAGRDTVSS
jgi:PleD family two-component response regulator